jgi:hypothetical protein
MPWAEDVRAAGLEMTDTNKKTYPILSRCTKCGHSGELFISDEVLAKEVRLNMKEAVWPFYRAILVRRVVAAVAIAFVAGIVIGWRIG